jgi:hypothetical protein
MAAVAAKYVVIMLGLFNEEAEDPGVARRASGQSSW